MVRGRLFGRRAVKPAPLVPVIYRWDIDKTYLKSEFRTLREMVKIGFEKAEQKIDAPGVAALMRSLRRAAERSEREVRVYFISASPPQIGREIRKKFELDGIVHDGIVFKDQLHRLVRGKFRHLREHVGFKLTELLKSRLQAPPEAREYVFGDDWETDPLIYSLYADVGAGRLSPEALVEVLQAIRVDPPLVTEARQLALAMPPHDFVGRIFINLEKRTPPAQLRAFGTRLVPTHNYFQTAACLFEEGVLDRIGVVTVARALLESPAYTPERLLNSLDDIHRRGHLLAASVARVREALEEEGIVPGARKRRRDLWRASLRRIWARLRRPRPQSISLEPVLIDYRALVIGQQEAETSQGHV